MVTNSKRGEFSAACRRFTGRAAVAIAVGLGIAAFLGTAQIAAAGAPVAHPAPAIPARQTPPCRPDAPCPGSPAVAQSSVVITWTAPQRYDYFRVSFAVTGGRENIRQTAGGTKGRFFVRPYRRNTVYTFKVQGCLRVRNAQPNCTPFSDPVKIAIGSDGKAAGSSPANPSPAATPTTASQGNTCPGAPEIESFGFSPDNVSLGENTTLRWGFVKNADKVTVNDEGVATPGSRQLTPDRTATYRITATGCGGTASREATVRVGLSRPDQGFPDGNVWDRNGNPTPFWSSGGGNQYGSIPGGVKYVVEFEYAAQDGQWQRLGDPCESDTADFCSATQELPQDAVKLRVRVRVLPNNLPVEPSPQMEREFDVI